MDKRRIRKYRRLESRIREMQRDYTRLFLDAMTISKDSEERLEALESAQRDFKEEIDAMKALLDPPEEVSR